VIADNALKESYSKKMQEAFAASYFRGTVHTDNSLLKYKELVLTFIDVLGFILLLVVYGVITGVPLVIVFLFL